MLCSGTLCVCFFFYLQSNNAKNKKFSVTTINFVFLRRKRIYTINWVWLDFPYGETFIHLTNQLKSCYVPEIQSNEQVFPPSLELTRDGEMGVKEAHKVLSVAARILNTGPVQRRSAWSLQIHEEFHVFLKYSGTIITYFNAFLSLSPSIPKSRH